MREPTAVLNFLTAHRKPEIQGADIWADCSLSWHRHLFWSYYEKYEAKLTALVCPSQRRGRSTGISCPVKAEVLLEWHVPQPMLVSQSTLCAAPGCCWAWPAPLLTLDWSLGCSALSVCWKSVLQVLEVTQFTWPLESETGKCQFRSSHGGAIYLQVLSPGLF